eukprot:3257672-Pyramimonas_sp.AAC.1
MQVSLTSPIWVKSCVMTAIWSQGPPLSQWPSAHPATVLLGPFRGPLGPSWDPLGALLARLGAQEARATHSSSARERLRAPASAWDTGGPCP